VEGASGMYREQRNTYRMLMGKPEGMRPRGRKVPIWEDNIKIDLKKKK
jgi:hypothetical protein